MSKGVCMKNHFSNVLEYCKDNKVEINFSKDGISLWAEIDKIIFTIASIKPNDISGHIAEINTFRKTKWRAV